MTTVRHVTAPAYWASALINGDDSGLDDTEIAALANWQRIELAPGESVVDCENEPHFTWSYDLHSHTTTRGGDVLDYTVLSP